MADAMQCRKLSDVREATLKGSPVGHQLELSSPFGEGKCADMVRKRSTQVELRMRRLT